jgi:gluconate kinase
MRQRQHFMPVTLLESQLATLETPSDAITVDIDQPIEMLVLELESRLKWDLPAVTSRFLSIGPRASALL